MSQINKTRSSKIWVVKQLEALKPTASEKTNSSKVWTIVVDHALSSFIRQKVKIERSLARLIDVWKHMNKKSCKHKLRFLNQGGKGIHSTVKFVIPTVKVCVKPGDCKNLFQLLWNLIRLIVRDLKVGGITQLTGQLVLLFIKRSCKSSVNKSHLSKHAKVISCMSPNGDRFKVEFGKQLSNLLHTRVNQDPYLRQAHINCLIDGITNIMGKIIYDSLYGIVLDELHTRQPHITSFLTSSVDGKKRKTSNKRSSKIVKRRR